jgi:large subunit ribosomal protein L11
MFYLIEPSTATMLREQVRTCESFNNFSFAIPHQTLKFSTSPTSMAKKVKTILKLNLPAGQANPAPPVGPALGQHGVNIMDFVNQYNQSTQDKKGQVIPAEVTIYEDRSFTFITKLPPVSELIKQKLKLKKGAKETGRQTVGQLTKKQVKEIAQAKLPDLNTQDINAAIKIVGGTAKSMGVKIK